MKVMKSFLFQGSGLKCTHKLKATDEEFPGYVTPIDNILDRFKNEGMKVVLGKNPKSGNVFILPSQSDDIENDMILPKHLQTNSELNEELRKLIENS